LDGCELYKYVCFYRHGSKDKKGIPCTLYPYVDMYGLWGMTVMAVNVEWIKEINGIILPIAAG